MIRSCPWLLSLVLLAAACGGDPSGPLTGSLAVQVSGLPAGVPPELTVSGPGGYAHDLAASATLSGLTPGTYTVDAASVSSGGADYQASPASQTVKVTEGDTPVAVQVSYTLLAGSLSVRVAGLPAGTAASVLVTGPDQFSQALAGAATLSGLRPGVYTVTAASVSGGGIAYDPSPAAQNANVVAGSTTSATVTYAVSTAAGLNLRIDGMYLTQSVQTYAGAVPLVRDRDGLLRIFVTANAANVAQPAVRVRFFSGGSLVSEMTVPAPSLSVPLSPDETSLGASWNVPVPKALIQPNLSMLAEVDPDNAIAESNEADNVFPASGTPLPLDVRTTSPFNVRFVPVLQSVNGRQGNVTNANKASYLVQSLRVHPLAAIDADLRAPYTTNAPALTSGNDHGEWNTILSELDALRLADGGGRYYYGVVDPSYSSGVAGIGYVGGMTAVGWDLHGADEIAAHEWGHNWGRQHAPCGGATNPDPFYPYAGGSIGVFGFDMASQTLKPPSSSDVMGYCTNPWISDYTYQAVLNWRAARADVASDFAAALQPCLLVWGRVVDGRPVLEPAFTIVTRPSLPGRPGTYRIEGVTVSGGRIFDLRFAPEVVADAPRGGEQFAFAVPLPPDRSAQLASLRLTVPGHPSVSAQAPLDAIDARGALPSVQASRLDAGRVRLIWDATRHPMALIRDTGTGQILSFARGGVADVGTGVGELEVDLSNGVGSRGVRVTVAPK